MPSLSTAGLFCVAAVVLVAIPGPAVIYILTSSVSQGRAAGLVSALGIAAGGTVHVAAATVGISAVLASSAAAYSVVRYGGAAYLIYLGVQRLRHHATRATDARPPDSHRRVFRQAVIVQSLNPKVALFFLALLPQFIDRARGPVWSQAAILGSIFLGVALIGDSLWAVTASAASAWLRRRPAAARRGDALAGGAYLALGATAALAGGRHG